ncbi:putative uncharacterized protein FLJ43944 [Pongo pygmaeus]|uniref:putative uncharacterized protein FLJ43944 n=1 Tax=Pongo pygmaeus TaxID=9600 RepID=UPI0023E22BDE|nr:putative uncharacterized protein FLJ43944 [Pongo pygmaeus]
MMNFLHQEPTTQPPIQLSSDFVSSLNDEMVFSPLNLSSIFGSNSTLPNTTVKNVDMAVTIPTAVTMEVEPSPVQQDNPFIPTEQADFSLTQPDPPSSPLDSPERTESPAQQEAPAQTPDPPKEVEPSLVQQSSQLSHQSPLRRLNHLQPSRKPQVILRSPLKRSSMKPGFQ